jgi:hypothetical protein
MNAVEDKTCVKFVNRTDQVDFVFITSGLGECKSKVGRMGGKQNMTLVKPNGYGCHSKGKILHEIVHLLGFHHFHHSPNRDKFIKINWENVDSEKVEKFHLNQEEDVTDFGTGYDYDSILHSKQTKYSKDKVNITIETRDPKNQHRIGQRKKLSDGDILRINRMYKCDEKNYLNKTELE